MLWYTDVPMYRFISMIQLRRQANGKLSLCVVVFQSKNRLYRYDRFVTCIYHIKCCYVNVFFVCLFVFCRYTGWYFILRSPCHTYCISSVASDNGGSWQGSNRTENKCIKCLCSSAHHAFPVFYLLYHCLEIDSFPLFLAKNVTLSNSSH